MDLVHLGFGDLGDGGGAIADGVADVWHRPRTSNALGAFFPVRELESFDGCPLDLSPNHDSGRANGIDVITGFGHLDTSRGRARLPPGVTRRGG